MAAKVAIITMGCSKNRCDSEHLAAQFQSNGFTVVPEESVFDGNTLNIKSFIDYVLINTCGFICDAKQESIDMILEAVEFKASGMVGKIYVFGCLSQRYLHELEQEMPEVDGFFGANISYSGEGDALLKQFSLKWDKSLDEQRVLSTPGHYAYLKISEGCDRRCSYCAIPLIRGKHVSVPKEKLVREASLLAEKGVKELIVVAQDTSYYGIDIEHKRTLCSLLETLCEVPGIEWIRFHYAYPEGFPLDVLKLMSGTKKICSYIDIPLQHISDKVLGAMRRSTTKAETYRLIEAFRKEVPDVALRTTLMVGHPGEDRKAFEELLQFVKDAKFERMGAFIYSEEEGTYGASAYKDSVTKQTKQRRYGRLMEVQREVSLAYNRSRIGKIYNVIVDGVFDNMVVCRSQYDSPEVDGNILVPFAHFRKSGIIPTPGSFVFVKIIGANDYDLQGTLCTQQIN